MRKRPLAEQVVVIVGGTSGVGRAAATAAAARGARVAVCARGQDGLDATLRELRDGFASRVDVADGAALEAFFADVNARWGRIDSVVACAFTSVYAEFDETAPDELRRVMDVNFFGRANALRSALPYLRASRGTFVDVSSALAYRGIPLQSAYCASKAAGRTLFESVRTELQKARAGVDLCVILPGAINTPHFDRVRQRIGYHPQPVPPIYQPEVVAEAILHCLERPERELPVSWGGQKALWGQKVAPRALDVFMRLTAWKSQRTDEPWQQPEGNLFEPLPGDPGAHGAFDDRARASSAWTALRLHRPLAVAAVAAAAAAAVVRR